MTAAKKILRGPRTVLDGFRALPKSFAAETLIGGGLGTHLSRAASRREEEDHEARG
jgi:hypothetical protein